MPDRGPEHPLVLIAAVRRTGSTLLAELLTELPRTFVFREPRLFLGRVDLHPDDVRHVKTAMGLDLGRAGLHDAEPGVAARRFVDGVHDPLAARGVQVGLKEIRYGSRWSEVIDALEAAGPLRVVALGRDPRDIFLSLEEKSHLRRVRLPGPLDPATVALDIAREATVQEQVIARTGAMRVRYEDLCTDPGVLRAIRRFVGSATRGDGSVGLHKEENRVVHGSAVTARRAGRWQAEAEPSLVAAAEETARRLEEYCERWGYDAGRGDRSVG